MTQPDSPNNPKAEKAAARAYAKASRPWYKKKRFIFPAVLIAFIVAVTALSGTADTSTTSASSPVSPPAEQTTTGQGGQQAVQEDRENDVPAEYQSALAKAESYANTMNMSKQGVHDQLVSDYGEKFSKAAADYAMKHVEADWNANALAKAKEYQESMHMSPDAIRDQLVSEYGEKFTKAEADYALKNL